MNDEEMKRLEELAQEAEDRKCGGYWPADLRALHGALWPKDVLALIERVRKAERKGAEEMRSAAAKMLVGANTRGRPTFYLARDVRALPLPGDAP